MHQESLNTKAQVCLYVIVSVRNCGIVGSKEQCCGPYITGGMEGSSFMICRFFNCQTCYRVFTPQRCIMQGLRFTYWGWWRFRQTGMRHCSWHSVALHLIWSRLWC